MNLGFFITHYTFYLTPEVVLSENSPMQGRGRRSSKTGLTPEVEPECNDLIVVLIGPDVMLQNPDFSKPFHVTQTQRS